MSGHHDDDAPIDRSLIEAALPAFDPTDDDHARVRRGVLAALAGGAVLTGAASAKAATGATTTAASTTAGATTATTTTAAAGASGAALTGAGVGLAWKVGLGVVAIASVVGAMSMTPDAPAARGTTAPAAASLEATSAAPTRQTAPSHTTPTLAEPPAIAPIPTPEIPSPETAPEAPRVRTVSRPAPSTEDTVLEEARLIAHANEAIDQHDGRAALALLVEHAHRFPEGQLREERYATRIRALCEMGDVARARSEAASFLNVFPASTHADRIRASCAGSAPAAP